MGRNADRLAGFEVEESGRHLAEVEDLHIAFTDPAAGYGHDGVGCTPVDLHIA